MSGTASLPRYAHRRGTRGFAAFLTLLAGAVVLGAGAIAAPKAALDPAFVSWLVIAALAFGFAHLVAAYGLIRRRAWSGVLVGYLATIGVGVAIYGLLLTFTGADPVGATSALPSEQAWAQGVGLLVWMIGLWLVAARYALKGVPPVGSTRSPRPLPSGSPT
jgi:branched-subunit amino acid ABC-type transport system permease component